MYFDLDILIDNLQMIPNFIWQDSVNLNGHTDN